MRRSSNGGFPILRCERMSRNGEEMGERENEGERERERETEG